MCVRAHEHVPTSLTCPSSVHRPPPPPPHTHPAAVSPGGKQMEGDRHTQTWGQFRTPRTRDDLCKDRTQAPPPGRRLRPQRGVAPGGSPDAHSRPDLPPDSLKGANGLLLPWKTEDCAMTAVLCSSKGGGHLWAPGIALGADAHRTPGSHLLSKQNVDLQLIPAGRILSSVQEEIDMDSGGCWGTRGAF